MKKKKSSSKNKLFGVSLLGAFIILFMTVFIPASNNVAPYVEDIETEVKKSIEVSPILQQDIIDVKTIDGYNPLTNTTTNVIENQEQPQITSSDTEIQQLSDELSDSVVATIIPTIMEIGKDDAVLDTKSVSNVNVVKQLSLLFAFITEPDKTIDITGNRLSISFKLEAEKGKSVIMSGKFIHRMNNQTVKEYVIESDGKTNSTTGKLDVRVNTLNGLSADFPIQNIPDGLVKWEFVLKDVIVTIGGEESKLDEYVFYSREFDSDSNRVFELKENGEVVKVYPTDSTLTYSAERDYVADAGCQNWVCNPIIQYSYPAIPVTITITNDAGEVVEPIKNTVGNEVVKIEYKLQRASKYMIKVIIHPPSSDNGSPSNVGSVDLERTIILELPKSQKNYSWSCSSVIQRSTYDHVRPFLNCNIPEG